MVLNSYLFYEEIAPSVLAQLAGPGGEEDEPTTQPEDASPSLYQALARGGHQLVLTDRIRVEYRKESDRYGGIDLAPVVEALLQRGIAVNPRGPGPKPELPGWPKKHKALFEEAVRNETQYLVTENDVWLERAGLLQRHGLEVVTPRQYLDSSG